VNDRSVKIHGGLQWIKTLCSQYIPINIVSGFTYISMHPYTNAEWDTLLHIIVTSDLDWDPTVFDILSMMMPIGLMPSQILKRIHMPICSIILVNITIVPLLRNMIYISLIPLVLRSRLILTHVLITVCMKPIIVIWLQIQRQLPLVHKWWSLVMLTMNGFVLYLGGCHCKLLVILSRLLCNTVECLWVLFSRSTSSLHSLHWMYSIKMNW
jgi:hypothetical protein